MQLGGSEHVATSLSSRSAGRFVRGVRRGAEAGAAGAAGLSRAARRADRCLRDHSAVDSPKAGHIGGGGVIVALHTGAGRVVVGRRCGGGAARCGCMARPLRAHVPRAAPARAPGRRALQPAAPHFGRDQRRAGGAACRGQGAVPDRAWHGRRYRARRRLARARHRHRYPAARGGGRQPRAGRLRGQRRLGGLHRFSLGHADRELT
eukprot:scaffold63256_cov73-Phaeocystis_antarctica.AAC.10